MKTLAAFVLAALAGGVVAQSSLPACTGSDASRWTNCLGTWTAPSGSKYVGEWRDGKDHGRADDFLIALEDMGSIDFYLEKLTQLGLEQELDFHVPAADERLVGWLKSAPIREVKKDGSPGLVIWDAYQHVDDCSSEVVVWEDEDFSAKTRQAFPVSTS